jgi:hypothetical protein
MSLKNIIIGAIIFSTLLASPFIAVYAGAPKEKSISKDINQDIVKALCIAELRKQETDSKQIDIGTISLSPAKYKGDNDLECLVNAIVIKGMRAVQPGISMPSSYKKSFLAQYTIDVDTVAMKASVREFDENGAKQVALAALTAMYFDLQPTSQSIDKISYIVPLNNKVCAIDLELSPPSLMMKSQWLVKKIDCAKADSK